ncbi:hypothetical protein FJZ19_03785 [Candidatus Pacearchaeota archaeon]|nr:hypothetical protein [Candidatus Pacearchaeota archaeon]
MKNKIKFEIPKPDEKEVRKLKEEAEKISQTIRKSGKVEVFIGGSLAKNTIIKKDKYDIDIFVRFPENKNISEKLEKILKKSKLKSEKIHGSRDYFKLKRKNIFEIIPVLRIRKPEEAKNVTDLSYFHVSYILKQMKKNKKLADEIILAKTFCYAQKCYGAESYIKGFSGYALELLVSYYGSFLGFVKAIAKAKKQIIIDPGKYFKNKQEILLNLNEAKLQSPIVFVDPTFKQRNALAALSSETFSRFQKACIKFLKNPSKKFFHQEKINEKNFNVIIEAETGKQEGDVAGSKLLKFFNFLVRDAENYFLILRKDFEYDKKARYYFKLKRRKERIFEGPVVSKLQNILAFKNKHKNVFIKNGRAYAREKINFNFSNYLARFKKKNQQVMKDMGINKLKIVKFK